MVYIFGRHNEAHVNTELVDIKDLSTKDEKELKTMIENHIAYTNSKKAKDILKNLTKKTFLKLCQEIMKNVRDDRALQR